MTQQQYNNNFEREFGWDDTIQKDSEFVLLPDGLNLFLHSSTEGMLSAFFGAIGQKRKGEPLRMDWDAIIGKVGVCKVGSREYNGNKYNEVKGMIYAEDVDYTKVLNAQPGQQDPSYQQQASQYQQPAQPQGGFTGGPF